MSGTPKERAKSPRSPAKVRPVSMQSDAVTVPNAAAPVTALPIIAAPVSADPAVAAPAAPVVAPVTPDRTPPILNTVPISPVYKEKIMATAFETTKDTVADTVKASVSQFNESAEAAMTNGKAAMEQVTAQAKDAVESSMKSLDEMTEVARGNVEALLASARVAAAGFETLAAHLSEVSRKSFESTTSTARAMASVKTPNELFQMQSDFAKAQFDSAVSEFSKLTEMMVKMSGEVMEPVQNRVAITTDKMKAVFTK